jgi:hypothetical protein
MTDDSRNEEQFRIYLTSGKQPNDLGMYDYCIEHPNLKYVLVIVDGIERMNATYTKDVVKFGLCVPRECKEPSDLRFLDDMYQ